MKLEKYYNYFQSLFENINVIEQPLNTLGYIQHLWGKDPLHFIDDYYIYLYKAVKLIVDFGDKAKTLLQQLKMEYSDKYALLLKQKKVEYFLAHIQTPTNLLFNHNFSEANGIVEKWVISLSKDSRYNPNTQALACGNEIKTWAILSQNIDISKLKDKNYFNNCSI